jgi:hypothetical protein
MPILRTTAVEASRFVTDASAYTLVFPCERRRLSGFAYSPAIVSHEKRVAFPFPVKQTFHRVVAHVQRVAFLTYRAALVSQKPTDF